MNIYGTVSSYVQKTALYHKAQLRLKNPYGIQDGNRSDALREAEQQVISRRVETIKNKMKSGKKLSGQELQFLSKYAPELFEKAVKIAKEREEYQKKLKKCRSKEEAQQVHLQKSQELASEAKAVSRANIPEGEKLGKLEEINMRAMAITDEYNNFVKSERYQTLPDKVEDKEANEEEAEAAEERIEDEIKAMEDADKARRESEAADEAEQTAQGGVARGRKPIQGIYTPGDITQAERSAEPAPLKQEHTASPPVPTAAQQDRALKAYKKLARRK